MKSFLNLMTIILIAMAVFFHGAASMADLKAGTARADITPELGCHLGGYYYIYDTAIGVHDPLHARVIALNDGTNTVVIVSMDLVIMGGVMAGEIKDQINTLFDIPPGNVVIMATHTHAGPEGYYEEFGKYPKKYDPEMKQAMERKVVAAVERALVSMVPASAGSAVIDLTGYNGNRRDGDGDVDPRGVLLVARDLDGKLIGGFLNFAAHPTIVNAAELLIGADWPGAFTAEMEKRLDSGYFLFLQGASGDISPRGVGDGNGWEQAENYGAKLAAAVAGHIDSIVTTSDFPVGGTVQEMIFPVRTYKTMAEFRNAIPGRTKQIQESGLPKDIQDRKIKLLQSRVAVESFIQPLIKTMSRVHKGRTRTWVQALRLGDTLAVTFPGEPIAKVGIMVRDSLAPRKVAVLGYSNDHLAYMSTPEVYEEGGYEAGMGLVYPEATLEMADTAVKLASELAADK